MTTIENIRTVNQRQSALERRIVETLDRLVRSEAGHARPSALPGLPGAKQPHEEILLRLCG